MVRLFRMLSSDSYILLAVAVILAIFLTHSTDDADETGRMAAFFSVLGDALALLALQPACRAKTESGGSEALISAIP